MHKTVVLNVVGLTRALIGDLTPFLSRFSREGGTHLIEQVLPAVTCSVQSTYLTGKKPREHGIVGNGWYFRDECEVRFWRQSNKLVQAEKVWETARKRDPKFTCANHFWWYNMYSSVDYSVTPRPNYLADGRKVPDIYTRPANLRDRLQKELGTFPLFHFWGPTTSIKSSEWIAEGAMITDEDYDPTLTLIYLPHLDYNLQRHGKDHASIKNDLAKIDRVCEKLVNYYRGKDAKILILSEYGITNVNNPISINRIFRKHNLLQIREEQGRELLDAGASEAFAVADHQVAHIYVNNKQKTGEVRDIISDTEGIELVLDENSKRDYGLNHPRAGELVAVADKNSWFTYYYWLDDRKAPDFASTVDIHRKPGYDPAEMFFNPESGAVKLRAGWKLLKKKLGFRVLMDLIPLDPTLIKGSHGRINERPEDHPVLLTDKRYALPEKIPPTEVRGIILSTLEERLEIER